MTRTRGLLIAAMALALVLTAPAATMALGTTPSAVQEETQTDDAANVTVTNLTAPASAQAGDTINVSATVTLAESGADGTDTAGNETETSATNETDAGTNETNTETNETDAGTNDTDADATDDNGTEVEVEYRLAGDVVATENVTLQPGESTDVNFSLDTTDLPAGGYVHSILAGDSGEDASILVLGGDAEEAPEFNANSTSFRVSNLSAPDEVTAGESIEVSATVSNPESAETTEDTEGDVTDAMDEAEDNATDATNDTDTTEDNATDATNDTDTTEDNATDTTTTDAQANGTTQVVEFRVGGQVADSQEVTLAPGESTTVNFTLETEDIDPGIYTHGILTEDFGEMATLSVTNETAEDTSTETTDETSTNETSTDATETPAPNGTDTGDDGTGSDATNATETAAPDGNESA